MQVLDPGHCYRLMELDGATWPGTILQFVKREGPSYPGNVGHYTGTTMQEVLRACIDRAGYVNRQIPCWQTRLGMYLMGIVVWLFEHRAAKRHHTRVPSLYEAIFGICCPTCGHVACNQKGRHAR